MYTSLFVRSVKMAPPTNGSIKRKKEDRTWMGVVNKDEAKSLNYSRDILPVTTGEQEEMMDVSYNLNTLLIKTTCFKQLSGNSPVLQDIV